MLEKGMKTTQSVGATLSHADLIAKLKRLVANEREATADALRSLMEFDERRLYLGEGYPSLFAVLHAGAPLRRTRGAEPDRGGACGPTAASPARTHRRRASAPDGCAAARAAPDQREFGSVARSRSPQEQARDRRNDRRAEARPDAAPMVRQLSTSTLCSSSSAEPPTTNFAASPSPSPAIPVATAAVARSAIIPLAAERFKVQFTISRETRDKLQQVQDLMRHLVTNGDPATIFDRALTVLRADLERKKFARPQPHAAPVRGTRADATSRPACAGRCGTATAVSALSWVPTADATNVGSWSSITSCHSRSAEQRRSRISNCAAALTTATKRRSFLPRKTRVF